MKILKLFLFLVVTLLIIQTNVFSTITSRVEGVVSDQDTGEPIPSAFVKLGEIIINQYGFSYRWVTRYTQTNQSGFFKFDQLTPQETKSFFIVVFQKGYAPYGPIPMSSLLVDKPTRAHKGYSMRNHYEALSRRYNDISPFIGAIDSFKIKQGDIKHFRIKLIKESRLIVKVFRKTSKGSEMIEDIGQTYLYHNHYYHRIKVINNGGIIEGLKPGIVQINFINPGWYREVRKNIKLEEGQIVTIERTLDYSTGQVLHGTVIDLATGKPLHVKAYFGRANPKPGDKALEDGYVNENGEFWYGGFEPGKYILTIRDFKTIDKTEILEFKPNEIKVKVWRFKVENN